ncbi:hypothetical protein ASF10_22235 [Flavobacterium sp. Leaf82]|uniref:hypothetical protein n=1 Tax=unclassified Flavobacterium TaxID=196869 RepID=UPI000701FD07|nr:hypothetical protein [Flavobacterium sp. Leaf82]KQO30725.1 hypothetical protein ASF10_22235 [Flavobacterium sp. Leaf82]
MNSNTATNNIFNSVERFNISSDTNFRNIESYSDKQQFTTLNDLYYKNEDEPDFDCEFLTNA